MRNHNRASKIEILCSECRVSAGATGDTHWLQYTPENRTLVMSKCEEHGVSFQVVTKILFGK